MRGLCESGYSCSFSAAWQHRVTFLLSSRIQESYKGIRGDSYASPKLATQRVRHTVSVPVLYHIVAVNAPIGSDSSKPIVP